MKIFFKISLIFIILITSVSFAQTLPALPQAYVDTTMPDTTGYAIVQVNAGGNLQNAIDGASCSPQGTIIKLQAGASFVGNFRLRNKACAPGKWIIIRTDAPDSALPPEGTRISSAYSAVMPKLSSSAGPYVALETDSGAFNYRIIGIEFVPLSGTAPNGIIRLGSYTETDATKLAYNIILDRLYIHGDPAAGGRRGVMLNSKSTAAIDSYISDWKDASTDSQAIAGWNGPGPFKIVNNYLEGAGENIAFGGAPATIPNLIPSDIEIRGNYFYKPNIWKTQGWLVKNLYETKNAQRVLIDGNIFENFWLAAQDNVINFKATTNTWAVTQDVTFTNNIVRTIYKGPVFCGGSCGDAGGSAGIRRFLLRNNLFEDVGGTYPGQGFLFEDVGGGVDDIIIDHNTAFHTSRVISVDGVPNNNFVFTNNLVAHNADGVRGAGTSTGNATLNTYFPSSVFAKNVLVGGPINSYPQTNRVCGVSGESCFPTGWSLVQFESQSGLLCGNCRLKASSPYKNAGTDGKDIGADIDALMAATAGVVIGVWSGSAGVNTTDTTPPVIYNGAPSGVLSGGTTQATLQVSTNEAATCRYSTSPNTAYTLMPNIFTTTGSYTHSSAISGLTNGGNYNYYIRCIDTSNNIDTSDYTITFSVAQLTNFGRPASDIATGWTGTVIPHWSNLDEAVIDDSDLIRTGFATGTEIDEIKLSPTLIPSVKTGHILRVRAATDNPTGVNRLNYSLVQGTTVIATASHSLRQTPNITTDNFTLTTAQANAITDYNDLRVRLTGTTSAGRIFAYWIEFEVPTGGSPTCGSTPASTCVSGSPPSYCSSSGTIVNDCQSCGCAGGQQCNTTTSACYTPGGGFSGLILNGRITKTTSGTPCASCTIDITLAGQTGSATTNAAGDFMIVLANPVAPGQYIADIGINDGVMQQSFKRRVTV